MMNVARRVQRFRASGKKLHGSADQLYVQDDLQGSGKQQQRGMALPTFEPAVPCCNAVAYSVADTRKRSFNDISLRDSRKRYGKCKLGDACTRYRGPPTDAMLAEKEQRQAMWKAKRDAGSAAGNNQPAPAEP